MSPSLTPPTESSHFHSSEKRSSSGVRNLRAYFEDKEGTARSERGRSPSGTSPATNGHKENIAPTQLPTRKVRSSFVSVPPPPAPRIVVMEQSQHAGSTSTGRRESFSVTGEEEREVRKSISEEKTRRESNAAIAEAVPEHAAASALPTPITEVTNPLGAARQTSTQEPEHPDKPVSSAEDADAELTSADPKSEAVISKGASGIPKANGKSKVPRASNVASSKPVAAVSQVAGKLSEKARSVTERLSTTSRASRPSLESSAVSPPPKSSRSAAVPLSSHLTAPTAASLARQEKPKESAAPAPKPVAARKPATGSAQVSSRLTAPTAAFAAKTEKADDSSKNTTGTSTTIRPRTSLAATLKPAAGRPSLGAAPKPKENKPPAAAAPKAAAKVSDDFLSRLTKPTAASKGHEGKDTATAGAIAPPKPSTNGAAKKPVAPKPAVAPAAPKISTATSILKEFPKAVTPSKTEEVEASVVQAKDLQSDKLVESIAENPAEPAKKPVEISAAVQEPAKDVPVSKEPAEEVAAPETSAAEVLEAEPVPTQVPEPKVEVQAPPFTKGETPAVKESEPVAAPATKEENISEPAATIPEPEKPAAIEPVEPAKSVEATSAAEVVAEAEETPAVDSPAAEVAPTSSSNKKKKKKNKNKNKQAAEAQETEPESPATPLAEEHKTFPNEKVLPTGTETPNFAGEEIH